MKLMTKLIASLALCLSAITTSAVQLSQNGLGQVLLFPYYTVNNNLNYLYSVVNTTDEPKAIKIRFLEGDIGKEVLDFNVYLSAYDVWTGALIPTQSTIPGHVGEPSAKHLSFDTSCAPFLNKAGQELLPFVIDEDIDPTNRNLSRATQGYWEVIEMGVVTGNAAIAVDHGTNGIPANCAALENAWSLEDGWNLAPLSDPTGGLMGSASLINVAEGIAFPYDAIALENFWQGAGMHTDPGSLLPDLSAAYPESRTLLPSGELAISEWETGFEAVSAVLMKAELHNEYVLDAGVAGKTEWVINFPTKSYHADQGLTAVAPFTSPWTGQGSCDDFTINRWDREEQADIVNGGTAGLPPPAPPSPKLCFANNVIEFIKPGGYIDATTKILGADDFITVEGIVTGVATENGWARINFDEEPNHRMIPVSGTGYVGLPATGFMVQQFTNAGAAEGLLAQYGNLFMHKGSVITSQ